MFQARLSQPRSTSRKNAQTRSPIVLSRRKCPFGQPKSLARGLPGVRGWVRQFQRLRSDWQLYLARDGQRRAARIRRGDRAIRRSIGCAQLGALLFRGRFRGECHHREPVFGWTELACLCVGIGSRDGAAVTLHLAVLLADLRTSASAGCGSSAVVRGHGAAERARLAAIWGGRAHDAPDGGGDGSRHRRCALVSFLAPIFVGGDPRATGVWSQSGRAARGAAKYCCSLPSPRASWVARARVPIPRSNGSTLRCCSRRRQWPRARSTLSSIRARRRVGAWRVARGAWARGAWARGRVGAWARGRVRRVGRVGAAGNGKVSRSLGPMIK